MAGIAGGVIGLIAIGFALYILIGRRKQSDSIPASEVTNDTDLSCDTITEEIDEPDTYNPLMSDASSDDAFCVSDSDEGLPLGP
jgi:hypothetical protein